MFFGKTFANLQARNSVEGDYISPKKKNAVQQKLFTLHFSVFNENIYVPDLLKVAHELSNVFSNFMIGHVAQTDNTLAVYFKTLTPNYRRVVENFCKDFINAVNTLTNDYNPVEISYI